MTDFREFEFFDGMLEALPLYEALKTELLARWPETAVTIQKSQIAFRLRGRPYCRVWLPTFRRIKGLPRHYIVITLGLRRREESPRIAQAVEPYPGRWTHHIPILSPSDLDGELFDWIAEAQAMLFSRK